MATLLLAGCAGSQGTHRIWTESEPAVVGSPAPSTPQATPAPVIAQPPPEVRRPQTAEEISGAAVTALMRQARASLDAGRPEQAAASLERALRIESRNYFVWSMLGQAYLAQRNYGQADSVAAKSNSLARGNAYAELENWRTIAAARDAMGDAEGAQLARQRVTELERWVYARPAP